MKLYEEIKKSADRGYKFHAVNEALDKLYENSFSAQYSVAGVKQAFYYWILLTAISTYESIVQPKHLGFIRDNSYANRLKKLEEAIAQDFIFIKDIIKYESYLEAQKHNPKHEQSTMHAPANHKN
uniref:Uncharacterized protein n=1 Tax=Ditylenchus dipsaci TaxID=166011 RepID=A0A915DIP4_9BILA